MSQLFDTLIGMDPSGEGALLLCTIMAAALGVLLVVGFGLVRPPRQSSRQGGKHGASTVADLGLLSLWRLNRSLGKRAHPRPGDAPAVDPVRTTP